MRRPLLFKKKPEAEQASPFFKKKHDDQFFSAGKAQPREQDSQGSDRVTSLSKDTQREMGSALGGDFTNVKIHTGPHAERMNKSMNAYAFTYGKDIYFNKNMFNESTRQGKLLLAHELVHTMQQQPGRTESNWSNEQAIENETDAVAENALKTLDGNRHSKTAGDGKNKLTVPTTGLKVQRCARAPSGPNLNWIITVPKSGPGPGGWKEASTWAGFFAGGHFPRNVKCRMLIGVPIENYLGPVSDEYATTVTMESMQVVGNEMQAEMRAMDPWHGMPDDVICIEYRKRVEAVMQVSIPGTRIKLT